MQGEALIIKFYEFNGKSVSVDSLKKYLDEVRKYLDAIGHGPYVPTLKVIQARIVKAIKTLTESKISEVEKIEIEPVTVADEKQPAPKPAPGLGEIRKVVKEELSKIDKQRAAHKVEKVMREFKEKKLKTPQGKLVKKRAQAVAIAISEAKPKPAPLEPKKRAGLKGIGENKSLQPGESQAAPLPKVTPPAEPVPTKKLASASDLAGISFKTFELGEPYKSDFHKLNSDTQIMMWGAPGSGKTVYELKFAQYLAEKLGLKVLYVANEEFGRSTFAEKLTNFKIGHPNLSFSKTLDEDLINQFDVIFADSVNSLGMTLEDYRKLVQAHPGKMFVIIVQSTKDGDFRGGKDWEHEVDVAGEVKNRKLILRKNRLDSDNAKKAEELNKQEAITEAKKKLEIKQAVKASLESETASPAPETSEPKQAAA